MKKPSKIESDDDVVLSDSGESVIEHKHVRQPSINYNFNIFSEVIEDVSKLRTAISTDSFEFPTTHFRTCTLQELEEEVLKFVLDVAVHSLAYAISELKAHFDRAVGYTDEDKKYIFKSLIGKMHAREAPKENVDVALSLLNKII